MVGQESTMERGFFDMLREKLHIDALIEKIKLSKDTIIDVGVYVGIGLLSGFIIKRYSTYFITAAIIFAFLGMFNHFEFISLAINWKAIYAALGIDPIAESGESLIAVFWQWSKDNVLLAVSALIGFLVGLKAG
jgi:hypothetical protein